MRIVVAGVAFDLEPDARLTPADRASLARLSAVDSTAARLAGGSAFRIELREDNSRLAAQRRAHVEGTPAAVEVIDGRVRLTHQRLLAEIDPAEGCAWVARPPEGGLGVDVALRTTLSTVLPARGGLPLHSAGVVIGERGVSFFGPSGAGKSTLSAACPWPVLSDELVVLFGDPPRIQGTGFWGTHAGENAVAQSYPLAALVELAQGARFSMLRLDSRAALRRLLGVVPIPADPRVWQLALAVLARLAGDVPVYRLTWNPTQPPWADISATLGLFETTA